MLSAFSGTATAVGWPDTQARPLTLTLTLALALALALALTCSEARVANGEVASYSLQ